MTVDNT